MVGSLFFRGPHLDLSSADRLPGHHGTKYNKDQYTQSDLWSATHCWSVCKSERQWGFSSFLHLNTYNKSCAKTQFSIHLFQIWFKKWIIIFYRMFQVTFWLLTALLGTVKICSKWPHDVNTFIKAKFILFSKIHFSSGKDEEKMTDMIPIFNTWTMLHKLFSEHPVLHISCLDHTLIFHFFPLHKNITAATGLTSRHLFHEDLYEAVLTDGAQVLDDVLVL